MMIRDMIRESSRLNRMRMKINIVFFVLLSVIACRGGVQTNVVDGIAWVCEEDVNTISIRSAWLAEGGDGAGLVAFLFTRKVRRHRRSEM